MIEAKWRVFSVFSPVVCRLCYEGVLGLFAASDVVCTGSAPLAFFVGHTVF